MSQQVNRALDVIELLVPQPDGLALGKIAELLDLPKSAAHRVLSHLLEREYVERSPDGQRYRLTMRLAMLGFRQLASSGVADVCQPVLDALASSTGELARLAVDHGGGLTWVAQAQGARYGLRYDGNLGRQVTLPATATGKAWLAALPERDAMRIVAEHGFGDPRELGRNAIGDIASLAEALGRTRRDGFATAYEEGEPGMAAVAAAIPGPRPDQGPVGTVSVAGPTVRTSRAALRELGPRLVEAASELSGLWPIRRFQPAAATPDSITAESRSA